MDTEAQLEIIKRHSATVHGEAELRRKLDAGRPLRVKYGIDPTAPDVHLGHTVPLRLLRTLQDMGHTAVIIIGDATARVGDPTGRDETRAVKTPDEIKENVRKYKDQIAKVIDVGRAEFQLNGNWFGCTSFEGVLTLMSKFTVQQLLTRDDFSKRYAGNTPISLHELMYPIMQGYDSVMMDADIEIGGTEQLFNMNMGRDMQRMWDREPQVVITLPILRGTDGTRRMGKSLGNYVGVGEPPFEMYSKVMSIPDDLMKEWYTLLTNVCDFTADSFFVLHHPKEVKQRLAEIIVRQYHGDDAAARAGKDWTTQFSNGGVPDVIQEVFLPRAGLVENDGCVLCHKLVREMGFAASNNEARRLIDQNAVSSLSAADGKFVKLHPAYADKTSIKVDDGDVFKVGRKIRKLRLV